MRLGVMFCQLFAKFYVNPCEIYQTKNKLSTTNSRCFEGSSGMSILAINPSYAVGVIFKEFSVHFGTRVMVFSGFLKNVDSKTACSPDQVP